MRIQLNVDGVDYNIDLNFSIEKDGRLCYNAEYKGSTISTFPHNETFDGYSLDESLGKIAKRLRAALDELSEY